MQHLLRSQGMRVSQARIGSALRTFPLAHSQRVNNIVHHINPLPYRATFFVEKLHFDQNEKLNMYRVVHVLTVDIHAWIHYTTSKKPYCNISIPVSSNSFEIWHVAATSYGSWNRICTGVYCTTVSCTYACSM